MTSFPPIFRTPAFAWACAALVGGSLAAALLLAARRPLRGLADGFLSMPPLRRTLAALVVAVAVAYAGGKGEGVGGEGVSSKEQGAGDKVVSSKEEGVSADLSSSVVAEGGTQQDIAHHTYSLLLPPSFLLLPPSSLNTSPSSFTMTLSPPGLVGAFAWTNACCRVSGDGLAFSFACGAECMCSGCAATGYFAYEGYRLPARGGACPCGGSGGAVVPGEDDDGKPDPLPGASARFSRRVILFEDEYEDAPGVTVPWRSTETDLDCRASGGPNGGRVRIEARGVDGLVPYGGLPLPFERELEPFESVAFKNAYRAVRPSGGEGDIVVTATFEENGTGAAWTSEDRATAVRVKLRARVHAPANDCDYRHRYGVREKVDCIQTPSSPTVSWVASGNGYVRGQEFTCPLNATGNPLAARCMDTDYVPNISVLAPSGVEARDVGAVVYDVPIGRAGGIGMEMHFYALPLEVSFAQIAIEEVPNDGGDHVGYFAHSEFRDWWHHDERTGAGNWLDVDECNKIGVDYPRLESELHRMTENGLFVDDPKYGWRYGELNWDNPFGWNERGTVRYSPEYARFAVDEKQNMVILETGRTGVRKLRNVVIRDISGDVHLNGVKVR